MSSDVNVIYERKKYEHNYVHMSIYNGGFAS